MTKSRRHQLIRLQRLRLEEQTAEMEEKLSLHWDHVIADDNHKIHESQTAITCLGYEIEQTRSFLNKLRVEHQKSETVRIRKAKQHLDKKNECNLTECPFKESKSTRADSRNS